MFIDGLDARLNVIVGPNARGKTTVLESLSLITNLKSFRTNQSADLIEEHQPQGSVTAHILKPAAAAITVGLDESKRLIKVDGQLIASKSKYSFLGSSVSFIPDDLGLIKGGPEGRRDLLNDLGTQLDAGYASHLQRYERTLKQRNQVLKRLKASDAHAVSRMTDLNELMSWTEELIKTAEPLMKSRLQIVKALNERLPTIYEQLFHVAEEISVDYEHALRERFGELSSFGEALQQRLQDLSVAEPAVGYTLTGPHRDDLGFRMNGREVRSFGSQGQIRGLVIALKIAQLELTRQFRKMTPILLLDDIISELDDERVRSLVHYLAQYPGQLFVTTAEIAKVETLHREFSGFRKIALNALTVPSIQPESPLIFDPIF